MPTAPCCYKKDIFTHKGFTSNYDMTTTFTIVGNPYPNHKYDFIPLIKWMPNICKWLGLGKMVRRNKRRV